MALSNTLKQNERSGSSRATQYVDKSSSTLTVELIFDTTLPGTDVRDQTHPINAHFMVAEHLEKNEQRTPKRCRFQWGAFAFIGVMSNFDETLDFFSPEGQPLRSTVAIKLSEDRYQHLGESREAAERETPTLTATGNSPEDSDGGEGGGDSQRQTSVDQAQSEAGGDPRDWRRTAMFNGVESPRLPGGAALSVPRSGAGGNAGAGFRFGASSRLGTNIGGAFAAGTDARASAGVSGSASASISVSGSAGAGVDGGVGFD